MSMSALGVLESSCDSLFKLLKSLDLPEMHQKCPVSKSWPLLFAQPTIYFAAETKIGLTQT